MPNPRTSEYALTVEEVIARTLEEDLGDEFFKSYLVGRIDTPTVNRSKLPALLISRFGSTVRAQTTATDIISYTIAITAILDRKQGFMGINGEEANSLMLNNLIDGIDPVTKEYSAFSVMGVLRKKFSLPQTSDDGLQIVGTIDDEIADVNYPVTRLRDTITTMEATIKLTVKKHVVVTGRA